MMTTTLPRGDVPEHDLRAWMYDFERKWLDELHRDDLRVSGTVRVVLQEHELVAEICRLRRDLHYARMGQTPPALPDVDESTTTSEPTTVGRV